MKTNLINLTDTAFKQIEDIMQKIAKDNNISDVTSVNIKLSKEDGFVNFDKIAITQDLAEEINPAMISPETGERVFPHGKLHGILDDLNTFIENHKESGMVPSNTIKNLESVYDQLTNIWSDFTDQVKGEGWAWRDNA